jgi:hypothetical protein
LAIFGLLIGFLILLFALAWLLSPVPTDGGGSSQTQGANDPAPQQQDTGMKSAIVRVTSDPSGMPFEGDDPTRMLRVP